MSSFFEMHAGKANAEKYIKKTQMKPMNYYYILEMLKNYYRLTDTVC